MLCIIWPLAWWSHRRDRFNLLELFVVIIRAFEWVSFGLDLEIFCGALNLLWRWISFCQVFVFLVSLTWSEYLLHDLRLIFVVNHWLMSTGYSSYFSLSFLRFVLHRSLRSFVDIQLVLLSYYDGWSCISWVGVSCIFWGLSPEFPFVRNRSIDIRIIWKFGFC